MEEEIVEEKKEENIMFQVCLSWIWIAITTYLWGYVGLHIIKGKKDQIDKSVDLVMLFGICFLTVYAQFFSLFYNLCRHSLPMP